MANVSKNTDNEGSKIPKRICPILFCHIGRNGLWYWFLLLLGARIRYYTRGDRKKRQISGSKDAWHISRWVDSSTMWKHRQRWRRGMPLLSLVMNRINLNPASHHSYLLCTVGSLGFIFLLCLHHLRWWCESATRRKGGKLSLKINDQITYGAEHGLSRNGDSHNHKNRKEKEKKTKNKKTKRQTWRKR